MLFLFPSRLSPFRNVCGIALWSSPNGRASPPDYPEIKRTFGVSIAQIVSGEACSSVGSGDIYSPFYNAIKNAVFNQVIYPVVDR